MSDFIESPLPSPRMDAPAQEVRRTLGDIHARQSQVPTSASNLAASTGLLRHGPVAEDATPQQVQLPVGMMETIRAIALEAIDGIVEKRVDARIASLRVDLMSRAGLARAHQHEENRSPEQGFSPPPTQATPPRDTTSTTGLRDPTQLALEKMRLELFQERQKNQVLSERVNSLTSRPAPAISHFDRIANTQGMTGIPLTPLDPIQDFGQRNAAFPVGAASSTTGVPSAPILLGPPHYGLEEIRPADPEFGPVVSYRRYRLQNTNPDTGPAVSRHVGEYAKLFQPTMKNRKFNGSIPIAILDFLSSFKRTCDEHGVSEGLALLVVPHFLEGEVRALVEENFELSGIGLGGYRTWPEAVQLLLMNYAKDDQIKKAMREFQNCSMREDEDEMTFGRRLQRLARLCGGVIDSQKLVTRFCDGLPSYIQPMVLGLVPSLPQFNRYQTCVDKAAAIGATQRAVLSQVAQRNKPPKTDRARTTRVNQISFSSPPRDIGEETLSHSVPAILNVENERQDLSYATDSDTSFQTAAPYSSLPSPQVVGQPPTQTSSAQPIQVDALSADRRYRQRSHPPYSQQRNQPSDICFYCFATGHRQPNCPDGSRPRHDPHFQARLYYNYMALSDQQKEYLFSVNRAPLLLPTPSVAPSPGVNQEETKAQAGADTPTPSTVADTTGLTPTAVPKN